MKKFEKFVFLSDYRLVTAKVRDPEWLSRNEEMPSRPCRRVRRQRIIRLENESVTRARTEIKHGVAGREMCRRTVGAANPGEKLAPGPGQNSQTAENAITTSSSRN